MPLTDTAIRNAKPTVKPSKLFDGGGLFLLVQPTRGKQYRAMLDREEAAWKQGGPTA